MADDVREVKSRIDIAEVVGDYVQLKRAGNALKALCPFHSEKTPSFVVSRERQTYHCFGCGKGGDVFSFLMEIEGMNFREALENLAARVGVRLSARASEKGGAGGASGNLRGALEEGLKFFRESLDGASGEAARTYLARRGIDAEYCARFELGWAPSSWDALSRRLLSAGYTESRIIDSGLASRGERGGSYDRFRGRIIFPVRDEMAKITGFGGRLIDGEGAKYLNSPEGELFNKRRLLYLLHEAKRSIREKGRAILTEGYMDAIRAHMAGFTEAVASLGTALTDEQAALIKRFADLCYISYDADGAGREAAIRGMYVLQRAGVEVMVVSLPRGKDPDDVLSADDGAARFAKLMKEARPLPVYHAEARKDDLRNPSRKEAAIADVLSGLASVSYFDIARYRPKIAKIFSMTEGELETEIRAARKRLPGGSGKKTNKSAISAEDEEGKTASPCVYIDEGSDPEREKSVDLESALCSLLWRDEPLRAGVLKPAHLSLFTDDATSGIVSALLSGETPEDLETRWRSMGETLCPARLARGDAFVAENELGPSHAERLLEDIMRSSMKRRYDRLRPLVLSEEATAEETLEYMELAKKLKSGPRG